MHLVELKELLQEGDLRSDGLADDVVKIVLNNPIYFEELFECLQSENLIVRAHASDALEKILRVKKELIKPEITKLLVLAKSETLPVVKWHYAMIFSHIFEEIPSLDEMLDILFKYLSDESVFVISWAISSLTVIALKKRGKKRLILKKLEILNNYPSKAVQSRLQKAFLVLMKNKPIPKNWIKA